MEKLKKLEYVPESQRRYRTKDLNKKQAQDFNFRRLWRHADINEKITDHRETERKIALSQLNLQNDKGSKRFKVKNEQSNYSLRKKRTAKQNKNRKMKTITKNKKLKILSKSISVKKIPIKQVSYMKQGQNFRDDRSSSQILKIKSSLGVCQSETNENYESESIEKAYHEFLTTKMYLGKDYRRHHIIDYLKETVPSLINKEYFEEEVQIFEDESNIKLGLTERLNILQKSQQKCLCAKNLAKSFNCDIEDIHKTLKRHIKYVKEWEDIKLYSPHSSFSIKDLDTILYLWTSECTIQNYPITKNSIKHSAHPIAKVLDLEMFKASDCWLDYFVSKYGIHLKNESQEVLELAAEAIRTVKISDVIKKYSQTLSQSIQEKFLSNNNKPYTYKKKMKVYDTTNKMCIKIKGNNKTISEQAEIPEKLEVNHLNNNSIPPKNNIDIKQEPVVKNSQTEILPKLKSTCINEIHLISSEKCSINSILKQNLNSVSNINIKTENYYSPETWTTPNIAIESYEQALKYLKPLEEFVMLKSNFRAINYLNCLQNVLKELNKC
ncbi:uncharacterized protein LOC129606871 isoform X2 [Condylostylus longicornis]|nr:uncharacterized protein LOC129606871 isoform X2 [Condylostylus longicornis]XP_055373457.1 uncharacterized protein LOC129606871 isoform X2 [Condylostylus longicornis]XP_055373458.1 uncharacterized protein LOC129606871 isoform X2 [Condylostylus longicornis]XP_055373459.1 uncharacterized protein LOC129606871 isoform X2 [Condylostylus longicornis]XP_055373460.1 uncharacterized protein LOC129606871 isoform X2 [Condylostylus longicornis]XP_055373461.1 uncharacterized protein LOC129606871 isoform 